ncbi:hypothetical protein JL09_g6133 [Pichia kudriavzevii]|uniref:Uncharacterized protein n=1 Tax=Pichia kudriavzevii TaxID=4909 RepID=A0A099NPH8_PICKU|nr:hypothetical protein JL09_g6133 [Pichia kudriavzevii]
MIELVRLTSQQQYLKKNEISSIFYV